MKMKFPGRMRPPAGGRRESDSQVPFARRSLLEQMAGTFFVIYSYSSASLVFFCSLLGSRLVSLFPFYFPVSPLSFHLLSIPDFWRRTYARQRAERDFAHVLPNLEIVIRILNVKYTFDTKKQMFGSVLRLTELIRQ